MGKKLNLPEKNKNLKTAIVRRGKNNNAQIVNPKLLRMHCGLTEGNIMVTDDQNKLDLNRLRKL